VDVRRFHLGDGHEFADTMMQIVREKDTAETLLNYHAGYY